MVIVIGAGAAGLAAAWALRRRGIDFLVLEAADHAGGRIAGEEVEGFRIDTGAQVFTASYDTAIRLCGDLDVPLKNCSRRAGVYSRGRFRMLDPNDPWTNLRTLLAFNLFSPRGLWQLVRLARALRARRGCLSFADPSQALALDTQSTIADWLRRHAGPEVLEELAEASICTLTLAQPEEVGAAYGMALLWGFVFEPVDFVTPEGGMGSLAQALIDAVTDRIRLRTPVDRVIVEDGAVTGVQTGRGPVAADAVICATTASVARRLLPGLPAEMDSALRRVTYSSGCRAVFGVDRPTLPHGCYSVMFPRRERSFLVGYSDAAVKSPAVAPPGMGLIHAEAASNRADVLSALSEPDLHARILAEIGRFTPAMPEPRFARTYRWKEAVCLMPPGALTALDRLRRDLPKAIRGLALAGEYMQMPSVNGALASGIAAVDGLSGVGPADRLKT